MRRLDRSSLLAALLLIAGPSLATAQLFGERNLGSTIARPAFPDQVSGAGPSDRRFMRGTEEARTFVGAELLDLANPVGLQQALGIPPAGSAVTGLREEPQPRVNRLILEPPPVRPMPYRARLRVDFDYPHPTDAELTADLSQQVRSAMARLEAQPEVTVRVRGQTAILEGEVASHRSRALVEQLVRLEPGVSRIENRLVVTEPLPEPAELPEPWAIPEPSAQPEPEAP